jgi:hypothetical protein
MGYSTDFIGHVDINPVLNDDEMSYLKAFASSRRWAREGGPYDIPPNPAADQARDDVPVEQFNTVASGQPGLHCDWVPCWDGCCVSYTGYEKFYGSTAWMSYLIDHFLRPGAHAEQSGLAWFDGFTFDHRCDGVIAGCRRDNKELFLIRVEDNEVREEVLRPADQRYVDWGPLPYEAYQDAQNESRPRRRRRAKRRGRSAGAANVVALPSQTQD